MNRSGYTDDFEHLELYRGTVERSIKGKRGQAFLQELADEMDAMQEKILIKGDLINSKGECCALGVVAKSRGLNVSGMDYFYLSFKFDISRPLTAEIMFESDGEGWFSSVEEMPEHRWTRMRKKVADWLDPEKSVR